MDPSPTAPNPIAPTWPDAAPPIESRFPLVGRDELLLSLVAQVVDGEPVATVLTGLGGVGKTRLAAEIAHRLTARLEGRIAWISLSRAPRDGGLGTALAAGFGLAGLE